MKRYLLLANFILISLYIFSQDWQPFVLNQNSYYKQVFKDTIILENFLMDSLMDIAQMGMQFYLFNAKSELDDACFKQVKSDWDIQHHNHPNKFDSAWVANGEFNFYSYNIETDKYGSLHFEPYSKVGESWGSGEHIITCIKKEKQSFRGIEDSVKIFRHQGGLFEGMEYILSKHFGFIKFVPTYAYYNGYFENPPPEFELIGFKKGELSKGYTPDFSDFFNLQPGDMLYYKDSVPHFDLYFHIDSIINTFKSTDSVHYTVQRKIYNRERNDFSLSERDYFFTRAKDGKIISASTSSFCIVPKYYENSSEIIRTYSYALSITNDDTATFTKFYFPGRIIDNTNCLLSEMSDYSDLQIVSSATGVVYEEEFTYSTVTFSYLIGSIIKGNKSGITQIPLTTEVIPVKSYVKLYPNPTSDVITIVSNNVTEDIFFELTDLNGIQIIEKELKSDSERIELNDLKPGIYIYTLRSSNAIYKTDKLIKR
ncbi:T9SS type A sorting domain-containing protein [Saccharicrinis sp. FJH54]|uniref:T9SS type A sorting domain-containing protein n=1 Tax=Saccharicrinis sp. FJH54 TaxID=3344665 RepID=UPI0035D41365